MADSDEKNKTVPENEISEKKNGGKAETGKKEKKPRKKSEKILLAVLWVMFAGFAAMFAVTFIQEKLADYKTDSMQEELSDIKNSVKVSPVPEITAPAATPTPEPTQMPDATPTPTPTPTPVPPAEILPEYRELYERNSDMVGWLTIDDTVIDYPVMQTLDDEEYYLHRDFDKNESVNGCLLLDTDTLTGTGTRAMNYEDGTAPTTNLIIHGHTMKSGKMFGKLSDFEKESYGKAHHIIKFDTLYEHREYELIAVFRSQVFKKSDKVFKYYHFFNAETEEEFEDWYTNIILKSAYDTGVTAEFGDEFITLSCCAYHVDNGRFVVVGRRIRSSEGESDLPKK